VELAAPILKIAQRPSGAERLEPRTLTAT